MGALVHHMGSTAIEGMAAKPIVDMLLVVSDLDDLDRKGAALQALGYEVMGEFGIPGRRYFRRCTPEGVRSHHLHAYRQGSPEVQRHLAFRDYMNAHPAAAQAYAALKQGLATAFPEGGVGYVEGRDAFVKAHEAKALAWLRQSQWP